tara:strand:+ start:139 stop:2133 length:1995 start_codon:yes stop_codon:yes gene_type:complete
MNRFIINLKNLFQIKSRTDLIVEEFLLNKKFRYSWGLKKSGKYIRHKRNILKVVFIEDGFINSYGIRKQKIPLSISYDENGIFYDYKSKSKIFYFIKERLSPQENLRAKKIIKLWKQNNLSKYNFQNFISPPKEKYILLIDQTLGDLSIFYGGASGESFHKMFDFACKKWPDHKIVLKIHPEVINSIKKGCFDKVLYQKRNVIVISELGQINKLIEQSSAVCVVTSQVGFEALIYGKQVHVFGRPFYAGLGLTIDHHISLKNKISSKISIEQLVFASLIKYQKYLDPRNNKICQLEKIIEYLGKKRRLSNLIPDDCQALNLTPWKVKQINNFLLEAGKKKVSFFKGYSIKMKNILVWGKSQKYIGNISKVDNFISVEDGFIRSSGLGGNLYPPLSLLFDKRSVHYDYRKVSDLEDSLQNRLVSEDEINRSKKLIRFIKKYKVSKYNLKSQNKYKLRGIINKEKILVLGQVETDNSILYGIPENIIERTNFSLIKQVKKDYPDSYIIYKPHPDLEAGLRAKGSNEFLIQDLVDFIAYNTCLEDLFSEVNRVVVFTSLGGFEALINNIPVTTYGVPFYAGWGLTEDKNLPQNIQNRRARILTLEELVFIALIEYPYYFSLKYKCLTEVENILDELDVYRYKKMNLEQNIFRYWGFLKDLLIAKMKK